MNKKIIYELKGIYRDSFRVTGYEYGEGEKSVCIIGNLRGNEVQQIYCCSQLVRKFKQLESEGRINKGHKVLIIPSANPYSVNIQKRFWPSDNTDINRMFPGYNMGKLHSVLRMVYLKKLLDINMAYSLLLFICLEILCHMSV